MGKTSIATKRATNETAASKLSDLIVRLVDAKGPDRELDLQIQILVNPEGDIAKLVNNPVYRRGLDGKEGYAWGIGPLDQSILFEKYTNDGYCTYSGGYPLPHFTSSIDASMTLVKPEWRVYAIQEEYITPRGNWFAGLDHRTEHYRNGSKVGKAPTPALALCIAALKAREAVSVAEDRS